MAEVPHVSVVAPCFNEEAVLRQFHERVSAVCREVGSAYEIVLVNDGSKDGTWAIMQELAVEDPRTVVINLSRNHGHQLALTAGLSVCRGQRVLIIDADLQDPPELLPDMMRKMDDGVDVVYGQRRKRAGETKFKLFTAAVFYRLIGSMTDTPIPPNTGDFRLISRRALDVLMSMPERHRFIRGMVSWVGFTQKPLSYDRDARAAGETKYPLSKMVKFAIDAITAFSTKPLTLAVWIGVLAGLFALLMIIYALVSKFFFATEAGWTSLMAVVSLLSAAQLVVLGIFGEYLGRLYEQSKGRPLFIIQDIVGGSEVDAAVEDQGDNR